MTKALAPAAGTREKTVKPHLNIVVSVSLDSPAGVQPASERARPQVALEIAASADVSQEDVDQVREIWQLACDLLALSSVGLVDATLMRLVLAPMLASAAVESPTAPKGSGLPEIERSALESVGAVFGPLPPLAQRATFQTQAAAGALVMQSLDVAGTAELLGRTPARVRQRLTERTLLGVRVGSVWRVPQFQFDDGAELPGWDVVMAAFPADVHPVAVQRFLDQANTDLVPNGEPCSPRQWLRSGGDPVLVAQQVADAYDMP